MTLRQDNSSCNQTNLSHSDAEEAITDTVKIAMTSLYIVSFLVALIGNSLGIYIIWRRCGIRAATHLLIANLACSNLLIALVVMPTSVAFLYKEYRWIDGIAGTVTCKLTQYLFVLPIASSIFSILVVSVDRFFAVFYPLNGQLFRRPKVMTATIWVCSAILMSPSLATFQVKPRPDGNWHCMFGFGDDPQMAEMLPKVYYSFLFAVLYFFASCHHCRPLYARYLQAPPS